LTFNLGKASLVGAPSSNAKPQLMRRSE